MTDLSYISVVIPVYNASEFVVQAVDSVLQQSYGSFEVIVVDDGSTDDSIARVRSLQSPCLVVLEGSNRGVAAARNRGVAAARGDLIAFLDADDRWFAHKLEIQMRRLQKDERIVAIGSRMLYVTPDGRPLGATGIETMDQAAQQRVKEARLMPFPISSLLVRRSAFECVGPFDESLQRDVPGQVEDLDFLARLARCGPIACVDDTLGEYRIHSGSASARELHSQQLGSRYIRARIAARSKGLELSWKEFTASHHLTLRQRWGDFARRWYRATGLAFAEGEYWRALGRGIVTFTCAPRYFLTRLAGQIRIGR